VVVLTIKVGSVKHVVRLWDEGWLSLQQPFPVQLREQGHGLHFCGNGTRHFSNEYFFPPFTLCVTAMNNPETMELPCLGMFSARVARPE